MTKIKQIQLHNFQSYENGVIDLHEGINIFVGTSNHGKSAIIRALLWVITNRPMGTGFVSYWSIKHEKIDTSVKVFLYDGNIIERKRTDDFNGYVINNTKELEAVGHDVPFEVQKLFGLADYNVQQQFDSPFLLSSSSGEVAKFFNQVIKIDDIDQMLNVVGQKKRRTKTDLSYTEKIIKQYEDDLEKLDWIEQIKDIIPIAEALNQQINNNKEKYTNIATLLFEYRQKKDIYKEIDFLLLINIFQSTDILIQNKKEREEKRKTIADLANKYYVLKYFINKNKDPFESINECEKIIGRITDNNRKKRMLYRLVDEYAILNKERDKYQDIDKLPVLFEKMERLQNKIDRKMNRNITIKMLMKEFSNSMNRITMLKKQLNEIDENMPDVCPLCGNKLKEK